LLNITDSKVDTGYTIELADGPVTFNAALRAPCEGYLLKDYTAYVLLHWGEQLLTALNEYASPVHMDKSWTDYSVNLSTYYDDSMASIPPDGTGGGNYVDVGLRIVVCMASNTAMVCVSTSHFS
jgi:hypothetical protein